MADLSARLQALEDREAVRDLIARYGPLADSGDAVAVAALWTPDGCYAVAGMAEATGHAAIAALIDGPVHRALMADGCAHILSLPAITLAGDEALAVNYSIVFRHGDGAFVAWRVAANRWQLTKGRDGWRVRRRDNAVLAGSATARALLSLR